MKSLEERVTTLEAEIQIIYLEMESMLKRRRGWRYKSDP